jgi:peptidoglycan hydrolase-like protein with peptidoglycan-binding domain
LRRPFIWLPAVALSGLLMTAAIAHSSAPARRAPATVGFDVSWPQCSGTTAHNMPSGRPSYMILGLTDGRGHTANPCLGSQLEWASSRGVRTGAYLVASYPDSMQRRLADTGPFGNCSNKKCRLRNDGAAQAASALAVMRAQGVNSPRVWIDVEFRHTYSWSHNNHQNAAVLQGIVRGLQDAQVPMGVYTTSYMWHAIAGNYRLDVPQWLPVVHGGAHKALAKCTTTATGGPTWMVQYTRALDNDLTCPVLDAVAGGRSKLWRYRNTVQKLFSQGAAVKVIQRHVGTLVTGQFGATTTLAVTNWQRSQGLALTGEVRPVDWRAMGAYQARDGHKFQIGKIARRS